MSTEVESGALGCAMLSNKASQVVVSVLTEDSFTSFENKAIFRIIKDIADGYSSPGLPEVAAELVKRNIDIPTSYLEAVCFTPSATSQVRWYCDEVKKAEDCRVIFERAKQVAEACKKQDRQKAVALSDTILKGLHGSGQTVFDPLESVESLRENITGGVPSYFNFLTGAMGHHHGYPKGELSLIGGNTGKGKTILGIQEWLAACRSGNRVFVATYEMDKRSLVSRLMNMVSGFPNPFIADKRGFKTEYLAAEDEVLGFDFEIYDPSSYFGAKRTVEELTEKVLASHERKPLDQIIIDYGQLLDTTLKGEIFERQDYVAQRLKRLALDTGASVLTLVQIKPDPTGEPQIRGSRSWKDHAALVVYRTDKKEKDMTTTFLKIDKNRFGKSLIQEVSFDDERVMFQEVL